MTAMMSVEYSRKIRRACLQAAFAAGESAAEQGYVRSDNPYGQPVMQQKWDDGFMSVHKNEIGMEYDAIA